MRSSLEEEPNVTRSRAQALAPGSCITRLDRRPQCGAGRRRRCGKRSNEASGSAKAPPVPVHSGRSRAERVRLNRRAAKLQRKVWHQQRVMGVRLSRQFTARHRDPLLKARFKLAVWAKRAARTNHSYARPPHKRAFLCIHRGEGSGARQPGTATTAGRRWTGASCAVTAPTCSASRGPRTAARRSSRSGPESMADVSRAGEAGRGPPAPAA
jgi:hypothetical protein